MRSIQSDAVACAFSNWSQSLFNVGKNCSKEAKAKMTITTPMSQTIEQRVIDNGESRIDVLSGVTQ